MVNNSQPDIWDDLFPGISASMCSHKASSTRKEMGPAPSGPGRLTGRRASRAHGFVAHDGCLGRKSLSLSRTNPKYKAG